MLEIATSPTFRAMPEHQEDNTRLRVLFEPFQGAKRFLV